ncbi:MAG TPA: CHAT domain-containing protein [Jiangellales bacterium]|nr:CHAT domain-containing protein [Jiangellales bacterium]
MKNTLITVKPRDADGQCRVEIYVENGEGGWSAQPMASSVIHADLDVDRAPEPLRGGAVGERLRSFILENRQSDEFETIGDFLGDLILCGEVGVRWDELRRANPGDLRTMVQIQPPELRLFPWELMRRESMLFVDPTEPFVRVELLGDGTEPHLGPIRALIVEGERSDELGTRAEIRAIKRVLPEFKGQLEAEFLVEPSRDDFDKTYSRLRPDIFHFIGHAEHKSNPALRVRDRTGGKTWWLRRSYIVHSMRPAPRLAILNACRSGALDEIGGLTKAFFDRGTAAVLGMQGDVRGRAAALFGGALYRALAEEQPIDIAVATARSAVYREVGEERGERDWILPSLTVRVPPEKVLAISPGISRDDRGVVNATLSSQVRLFVDRVNERHRLATSVDPDPDRQPVRLVVLSGDLKTGKSRLLHWVRRRCALRGRRVRYVNFNGKDTLDSVAALRVIRDAQEDLPSLARGTRNAFARFNYDLTFLTRGRLPEEPPGDLPDAAAPGPDDLGPGPVTRPDRMFQSFREALADATADRPLILILDQLEGLEKAAFQQQLYPLLIDKVVRGEIPGLRLILALSKEQERDYWPVGEGRAGEWIEVNLIDPDHYEALAEDMILALGIDFGPIQENIIKALKHTVTEPWRLEILKWVETHPVG